MGNLFLGSSLSLFPFGEPNVIGNTKEVRVENFLASGAIVAARVAKRLFKLSQCIQYGLYHRSRFLCENPEGTTGKQKRSSMISVLNRDELNFWVSVLDTTFLVPYTRFLPYFSCDMFGIEASYQNYGYIRGAELGFSPSQFELAKMYENGKGVGKDYAEAVKWYRKAADQRYAQAQSEVGECYYYGKGVNKDYAEAVKWCLKAAEQGNAEAQYNLGECYEYGHGVRKDYAEAERWYRLAAEHGNTDAMNKLGEIFEKL